MIEKKDTPAGYETPVGAGVTEEAHLFNDDELIISPEQADVKSNTSTEVCNYLAQRPFPAGDFIPKVLFTTLPAMLSEKLNRVTLVAVLVLGHVIYWYRPVEADSASPSPKFDGDMLCLTYGQLSDRYNIPRDCVKSAVDKLVSSGILVREFRTLVRNGVKSTNVMFLKPNISALDALLFPDNCQGGGGNSDHDLHGEVNTTSPDNCQGGGGNSDHDLHGEVNTTSPDNCQGGGGDFDHDLPPFFPPITRYILDISKTINDHTRLHTSSSVDYDVNVARGIPRSYIGNREQVAQAIPYLLDYKLRLEKGFYPLDANQIDSNSDMVAAYRVLTDCLIDMCSHPGLRHYNGHDATATDVVKIINRVVCESAPSLNTIAYAGALADWGEYAAQCLLGISTQDVRDPRSYIMSVIYNALINYRLSDEEVLP